MAKRTATLDDAKASTEKIFDRAVPSSVERHAAGKALRGVVSRESHARWAPSSARPDPVDVVIAADAGREPELLPIRHARMLSSSFAFLRGSAGAMAWDLAQTPTTGLRVQACGDCHLMNFGGFATPERNLAFDINDFDETLPAPWEWDVKRLAASAAVAGRYIGLSEVECRDIAYEATRSYCTHMQTYSRMTALQVWYDRIDAEDLIAQFDDPAARTNIRRRIDQLRKKTVADHDYPKLVETVGRRQLIRDKPPFIYHHEDQKNPQYSNYGGPVLKAYRESLPDHCRVLYDRYVVRDFAMKVVGVGSVGTSCWVALFMASDTDPLFLQVKQANASVLEPYAGKSAYKNQGQRVVVGQRVMQSASDIFLGWATATFNGRHFYVRQLRDMKISAVVESMSAAGLTTYVKLCGHALARAHASSGDAMMISGYTGGGKIFSSAVARFAMAYADQTEQDHHSIARAVGSGRLSTTTDF